MKEEHYYLNTFLEKLRFPKNNETIVNVEKYYNDIKIYYADGHDEIITAINANAEMEKQLNIMDGQYDYRLKLAKYCFMPNILDKLFKFAAEDIKDVSVIPIMIGSIAFPYIFTMLNIFGVVIMIGGGVIYPMVKCFSMFMALGNERIYDKEKKKLRSNLIEGQKKLGENSINDVQPLLIESPKDKKQKAAKLKSLIALRSEMGNFSENISNTLIPQTENKEYVKGSRKRR